LAWRIASPWQRQAAPKRRARPRRSEARPRHRGALDDASTRPVFLVTFAFERKDRDPGRLDADVAELASPARISLK
jgi:hypothetical protein